MPTRRVRPKRRHCSKPKSDARIRPFRLLELPGEIRNRVYGFVLSAPNGLTVRCEADTYQVNQLQYFCWQLRKETAGLEIQYNQVHFVDYPKMRGNAMIGFFVFAGGCKPKKLAWLTRVELVGPWTNKRRQSMLQWFVEEYTQVTKLLAFCSLCPHVSVRLQVPGFSFRQGSTMIPRHFIRLGIMFEYLVRDRDIVSVYGGKKDGLKLMEGMLDTVRNNQLKELGVCMEVIKSMGPSAPNLRFCPYTQGFTEDAFKEGIHRELAAATPEDFMYLASGGADAWMDFARRWVSDGV
ncbi:hypothetical protein A1F94_012070 [Pyrenophora tritici-repentis]|nr:hypothetical protein A1F94_012070 [Pyrenophora tritici-repentis]